MAVQRSLAKKKRPLAQLNYNSQLMSNRLEEQLDGTFMTSFRQQELLSKNVLATQSGQIDEQPEGHTVYILDGGQTLRLNNPCFSFNNDKLMQDYYVFRNN